MPEKFNQYYLTEILSKKYSHVTYLASPINEPEHQVVLTVFSSFLFRFPHERENLLQKAQRVKQLHHPRLVPILNMGIEEEQPFIVREYLSNGSLRKSLKKLSLDRLQLSEALNIISQVGEVLAYAHQQNIVHGNIKPENIFLDADGQALLTDFHLVSRKDASIRDQTSEEYAFCYMAPEQFAGITDARSDQYALGCLTYELITGRVPFTAQSLASMMGLPNNALPASLSESVADLPPSLEAAVLKTLAKDPTERFFDFSLFLEVIKSVLSPPPDFPLAQAIPSRKNRTIAYPVRSTKARNIAFSPRKRTASPNPVSDEHDLSDFMSNNKFDDKAPIDEYPVFQSEKHEKSDAHPLSEMLAASSDQSYPMPFPFAGEAHPLSDREDEKKANDWLINKAFGRDNDTLSRPMSKKEAVQEKADVSSIMLAEISDQEYSEYIGSESLIPESNEHAGAEEALLLTSNFDVDGLRVRRGGIRVMGLVLLVLVVMALIIYVFWPLLVTTHDTGLRTVNKMQGVIPQITSVSMEQVPLKATDMPTVQPTVTDTPTSQPSVTPAPIVQPAVLAPATNILPTPMPVPTPTPMPVPTPTPTPTDATITYEAEASQNTLAGGAQVISCSSCSGGSKVGYIGVFSSNKSGTLQFNNVNKANAGTYTLTLYYSNGSKSDRNEYISVNGGSAIVFIGSPTGGVDKFAVAGIAVSLKQGDNTIEFSNPNGAACDIDKITV